MASIYTRLKKRDRSADRTRTVFITDHDGSPLSPSITVFEKVERDFFSTEGVDLDDFKQRLKRGELLPLTPFRQIYRAHTGGQSYELDYTSTQYNHSCSWSPYTANTTISDLEVKTMMANFPVDYYLQRAASKIYGRGWDTLTFIVELKKTIQMFKDFLGKLIRLIRKILRSRLTLNDLQRNWLEYRYGWRTLYYDMLSIQELLANLNDEVVRVKERDGSSSKRETITSDSMTLGGAGDVHMQIHTTWKISVRGVVHADITPPKFIFNPAVTTWELVTFSFIIDWVLDVGQWLYSLSFLVLQDEYYAAGGYRIDGRRLTTTSSTSPNAGWTIGSSGTEIDRVVWTQRNPMTIPKIPQIKVRLDVFKVLDLLAILSQLLRSR